MPSVLVTGSAGFIGFHLCQKLLARGDRVTGLDNLNDYYDPVLKKARLSLLAGKPGFTFHPMDIGNGQALMDLVMAEKPRVVVNLAAQAGVRHSMHHPGAYVQSNLVGFFNVLEACRTAGVGHLVYASSSSVYGSNAKSPFSPHDGVGHPLSLYAATKRAGELIAHSHSHVYGLPCTGLRFFTVYGPWGRPDMTPYLFTQKILAGNSIEVFGDGLMERDFTYVDDIIEGLLRVVDRPAAPDLAWDSLHPDPASSTAPWRIYNIGNQNPVKLLDFIALLEKILGLKANKVFSPAPLVEVAATCADVSGLQKDFGYRPTTDLETGLSRFVEWYRSYHKVPG